MGNDLTEVVYTPASGSRQLAMVFGETLREFRYGRQLAWRLMVRNLNARYRQTYFGYLWAILPSVITAVVFVYLKEQNIIGAVANGVSYPVYVVTGVLLWHSFVESINSPLRMLNESVSYLGRINFPRIALIMAGFGEVMFNSLMRAVVLIAVFVVTDVESGRYALMAPFAFFSLLFLGFAIGIIVAPIGMLFRDIEKALLAITSIWFFLTPVFYAIPKDRPAELLYLNPVAPLLVTVREMLMGDSLTLPGWFAAYTLLSIAALLPALIVYKLSLPYIIERLEA